MNGPTPPPIKTPATQAHTHRFGMAVFLSGLLSLILSFSVLADDKTPRYQFGVVPQFEARSLAKIWQPILSAISERTGIRLEWAGSPSIPSFEKDIANGRFDLAYMNPYHLIVGNRQQGYVPLLRDKDRLLYGVLVVRKNSGISEPTQIDGDTVSFPAPNALGASLLMRAELKDNIGIDIKPRYVKTHDSVYLSVALGTTSAGGGVLRTLDHQPKAIRDTLKVVHTTSPTPSHPIAAHPRVPDSVRNAVIEAFLELGKSEEGRKLIAKIPMRRPEVAHIDDYNALKNMGLERFYIESDQ